MGALRLAARLRHQQLCRPPCVTRPACSSCQVAAHNTMLQVACSYVAMLQYLGCHGLETRRRSAAAKQFTQEVYPLTSTCQRRSGGPGLCPPPAGRQELSRGAAGTQQVSTVISWGVFVVCMAWVVCCGWQDHRYDEVQGAGSWQCFVCCQVTQTDPAAVWVLVASAGGAGRGQGRARGREQGPAPLTVEVECLQHGGGADVLGGCKQPHQQRGAQELLIAALAHTPGAEQLARTHLVVPVGGGWVGGRQRHMLLLGQPAPPSSLDSTAPP
jgi:hypothetical protein